MRAIRFRGQDEDGKWLYGDLRQRMGYWPAIIESYCTDEGKVGYREIAVKEDTVGQFTGLKDKNGREIYEGDIYWRDPAKGWSSWPYCVDYCNGAWIGKDSDGGWLALIEEDSELLSNQLDYIEVVGNIHDNPELLNAER
jgi:uncharacterized phage protein (TIGR01671 family)